MLPNRFPVRILLGLLLPALLCVTLLSSPVTGADRRSPVVLAVEKAETAVVNIRTEQVVNRRSSSFFGFSDPFFNEFFKSLMPPRIYRTESLGSGVIIHSDGYVLTNHHVIEKASRIYVALPDEVREREAELVGRAEILDLAVLRISGDGPFPFLSPRASGDLMLGETVIAIGNPLGLGHSVTTGIVSSPQRRVAMDKNVSTLFIQTDALINPGNSGGPLLNINGELIGINTAIAQQAQGIGFAIPSDTIRRVLDDMLEYGRVRHAYLGIYPVPVGEGFRSLRGAGGVLVNNVESGSPADQVGLKLADVILRFGGLHVATIAEFSALFDTYTPGDEVEIEILRGTEARVLKVTLSELPRDYGLKYAEQVFGFSITEASQGVAVGKVRSGTTAYDVGIRPGDLIVEIDGNTVESVADFSTIVASLIGREPLRFLVVRGSRGYFIELP